MEISPLSLVLRLPRLSRLPYALGRHTWMCGNEKEGDTDTVPCGQGLYPPPVGEFFVGAKAQGKNCFFGGLISSCR